MAADDSGSGHFEQLELSGAFNELDANPDVIEGTRPKVDVRRPEALPGFEPAALSDLPAYIT